MTSGVQYFPQVIGPNTVVGRLSSTAGITEAIPFAQLAVALGVGGSTYLLATNIAGTNTITGTTATGPLLTGNQVVFLIPANTNTGAVTFDRDAQGTPKNVFYNGAALVGGEIAAGVPSVWFYDGTQYNIIANGIAAGNAAARGTVASATTTNLDTSSSLTQQITGTTTITGFTLANGHVRIVEFAGILTLTNSASLILPGGANITTVVGDTAIFGGEPAGVVRCLSFTRANGKPVTPSDGASLILLSSQTAASSASVAFTTGIDATYDEYLFVGINVIPATNSTTLSVQMSKDAGATWEAGTSYQSVLHAQVTDATVVDGNSIGAATFSISPSGISNTTAGGGVNFEMRIFKPSGTTNNKQVDIRGSEANGASSTFGSFYGMAAGVGANLTNNAVNGFKFAMASGNIASGTIYLYGLRKT